MSHYMNTYFLALSLVRTHFGGLTFAHLAHWLMKAQPSHCAVCSQWRSPLVLWRGETHHLNPGDVFTKEQLSTQNLQAVCQVPWCRCSKWPCWQPTWRLYSSGVHSSPCWVWSSSGLWLSLGIIRCGCHCEPRKFWSNGSWDRMPVLIFRKPAISAEPHHKVKVQASWIISWTIRWTRLFC